MDLDINKILDEVNSRNLFLRVIITTIGTFLLALCYNLFLDPNNLVIGGLTGLSIVVKQVLHVDGTVFIYVATALLIIIGFILLERKDVFKGMFVAILYPFFITLTAPLCDIISKYLTFSDKILVALAAALVYGFANGIIYKCGFNTGGFDVVVKILNRYCKIPEGKANFVSSICVVIIGGIVFDANNVAYSAIILYLAALIIDKMIIGISDSKLFYIVTGEIDEVKKFIIEELKTGVTVFDTHGGFSKQKGKLLMCVVDNKDYYLFKEAILAIDENAFIIIDDCYEVSGGVKRERINLFEVK